MGSCKKENLREKSDSTKKTIELLTEDHIIKNLYQLSEKFSNYFANITVTGTYSSQSTFQCAENTNNISLYPVTAEEIYKLTKKSKKQLSMWN